MKKLKTRDEFLNESHGMGNELENARMMKGSASELVEWAQRKIAESRPENFKEGVINTIQEAKYDANTDVDDIFFLWDETVDDDRRGIGHGNGASNGKRYSEFVMDPGAKGYDKFRDEASALIKKNKWKHDWPGNILTIYESVNEKKSKEVTKKMWDKMGEDDRVDALLSAFKDPDDAEKYFDSDWDNLPEVAINNMTIYEGYGFVKISPKQDKLKLAIKKQERVARLKANRDKPIEFDQLSLNRIMLTKVLGRGDLEKEHEDAYQRLLKKYELREGYGDSLDHDIVMSVLDVAGMYTSDANPAASQQWNSIEELAKYIKGDFIAKKWHKKFDEGVERVKQRHNIKESVNEADAKAEAEETLQRMKDKLKFAQGKRSNAMHPFDPQKKMKDYVNQLKNYNIPYWEKEVAKLSESEEYELNEAMGPTSILLTAIALGLSIRLSLMPESKLQQILGTTVALSRYAWQSVKDFGYAVKRELPIIGPKIKKREADAKAFQLNKERTDKLKLDIESYIANEMSDEDIIEIFKSDPEFKWMLSVIAKGKKVSSTKFYNAVKKMLTGRTAGNTPAPITKLMKKIKNDLSMLESIEFEQYESVNEAKEPKFWDSLQTMKAIKAFTDGEFDIEDDKSIAAWDKKANGGTAPKPAFNTKELVSYAIATGKKPDGKKLEESVNEGQDIRFTLTGDEATKVDFFEKHSRFFDGPNVYDYLIIPHGEKYITCKQNKLKSCEAYLKKNNIEYKIQESVNEGKVINGDRIAMMGAKILKKIKIGTTFVTNNNEYTVTGFGPKANAFQEFEVSDKDGVAKKVKLTAMYGVKLEITDDPRSAVYSREEPLQSIITEAVVNESIPWATPIGFFTRSSNEMAQVLYESSTDLDQAMNNLNESLDIVEALLDNKSKANIEVAKKLLQQKY